MSDKIEAKGSCLCGAVEVEAHEVSSSIGACHCAMCRKWTGGPLLAVDCQDKVKFTNSEMISVYESSEWAERGFCSKCGTHLFYRLKEANQYIMPVGLFELDATMILDHQIFIDQKPDYYCFSNDTKDMTGAEVFAQFAGE